VISPGAALIACRFPHDASVMLLWGAFAYLATLVPEALAREIEQRLEAFRVVAIIVAVATTAAALPLETAMIGEGWPDALDPTTIRAVLFETSVGWAWQAQAVAAILVGVTLAASSARRQAATALASGLLLASLALTGHAAMDEGWLGTGHRVTDAVHVLSGGAWLGALVPLLPALGALEDSKHHGDAERAIRRFSAAGHVAVALVILSGTINTILVLGHWPVDWSSPYQAMLDAKIALVAVMVCLAIANHYGFVPRLASDRPYAIREIRSGTMAELTLGVGVIGLVSVFGVLEPR
jgi:putative copper resistance protein D